MGRTNPTFRNLLTGVEDRWQTFRRVLRRRDKPRFDRLFEYARAHADASGMLNHEDRLAPVLFSICLAQERRIDELEGRLEELEAGTEEIGTEETGTEEAVTEETRAEETGTEGAVTEETRAEETGTEGAVTEETRAEETGTEGAG